MNITDISTEQIRIARALLMLTQDHVAKAIGISATSYSAIETNKSNPKLDTFRNIIKFFINAGIIFREDGTVTLRK